jgi:hypothetical protein
MLQTRTTPEGIPSVKPNLQFGLDVKWEFVIPTAEKTVLIIRIVLIIDAESVSSK